MKVLFDTNVILDVMLDRVPFSGIAAKLLSFVETGKIQGFLGATTITTIHYIAQKAIGKEDALHEIEKLLTLFDISPVDKQVLTNALKTDFKDFEDAVLHEAGKASYVESIVTRNKKDFEHATIPVFSPQELLDKLNRD